MTPPLRILLEADNLTLPTGTGIATYARGLADNLAKLNHKVDALVGVRRSLSTKDPVLNELSFYDPRAQDPLRWPQRAKLMLNQITGSPFGINTGLLARSSAVIDPQPARFSTFDNVYTAANLVDRSRYHFKRYGQLLKINVAKQPNVFHATQAIPIHVPKAMKIYTIHDLVPLRLPYTTLDDKKYSLDMHRALAREADHIVTVSEFSRRDIIALLGVPENRITNTYQSVSLPKALVDRPFDDVANDLDRLFGLAAKDYFLYVGAIEPKKNVSRLVEAYASSGSKRPLIIVGNPAWMAEADLRKIDDERFLRYTYKDGVIAPSRQVRRLSYVPFEQLISLYRGARGLIFPSIYEGFGLPVLEAMLLGTPVITSNVSSLPEVAGDAALLVSPFDVLDIASAIRRLDADEALAKDLSHRGRARAATFSPEAYRNRLDALYKTVQPR
jgi:glycosyltransferase involved in cell wall biosynthesis